MYIAPQPIFILLIGTGFIGEGRSTIFFLSEFQGKMLAGGVFCMSTKVKVFVVGRPGSGKTTAVRRLRELARERDWIINRIKDYDILYSMFQAESNLQYKKFRPTAHEGFDVIDMSVFDTALEKLEKLVREEEKKRLSKKELIIIEFARNDYREAFEFFDPEFLRSSYFIFVDADIETCIRRIHDRIASCPAKEDNHYVSEYIIKSYYYRDNWEYMGSHLKKVYGIDEHRIEAVYNMGSLQEFINRVNRFADTIFTVRTHPRISIDGLQKFFREYLWRFSKKRNALVDNKFEDSKTPLAIGDLGIE